MAANLRERLEVGIGIPGEATRCAPTDSGSSPVDWRPIAGRISFPPSTGRCSGDIGRSPAVTGTGAAFIFDACAMRLTNALAMVLTSWSSALSPG